MEIKLQKFVSDCGLMSRRSAEKEIASGKFQINGAKASVGDRIDPELTVQVLAERKKRRESYMKWHKFFAWATVVCFFMTMVTGYKRK